MTTRTWFWPAVLVFGYLAQVVFRVVHVLHRAYPSVHADETSYLVLARILAGRPATEMPNETVIPGGYSLLISPALRLADNPVTAYHLVLGINALLNALVFPLVFVALRRLEIPRPLSGALAFAVALMPPVIFYSQFAMADAVFQVLVLCWLICMHGWLSEGPLRRRYAFGVGTGLAVGYAMATHDRGGVMVAITAVAFLAVLILNWAPRRTTLAAFAALAVGVGFAKLLSSYLTSQFAAKPSENGNAVLDGLKNPEILGRTITRVFGQFWYLMTSSWGIGAMGVALCVFALFSSRIDRAGRVVSFCMLAMMAGVALASAAALGDDPRIDNWVYARYLSPLVPGFFLIGAAALYRFRRRNLLYLTAGGVALMVLCAEIVIQYAGKELYRQAIIPWAMPDALFLAVDWGVLHIWRTMIGAGIVLAGCVLMRLTGGRKVMASVAAVLVLLAGFATNSVSTRVAEPYVKWRKNLATGFTHEAGIRKGDEVLMDWHVDWGLRMAQDYEVYWSRTTTMDLYNGKQPLPAGADVAVLELPGGDAAAAASSWPQPPKGWVLDRVSTQNRWVVWRHQG
ncbi:hypothetical protein [Kitasatospora sp. NPDC050543]|uniref:hypothetical protein n=1 Tax=Kitasatospora sp. NPDC050543 TaxID=3364054 RepID=UPI00378B58FB